MPPIYFDYNATTPLDPAVLEAMLPCLVANFGNPSSIHQIGRRARCALDDCRERAASVLGCKPSEVVFTSGGTESNNLAILGTARHRRDRGRHLITSATEHHAVLHACRQLEQREGFSVTYLAPDGRGRVAAEAVARALRPETILVSIMAANNETGVLQPVAEIGAICRTAGVPFHTDAVQWLGKESFRGVDQFQADLVSVCAHKFHGPKGAGILVLRAPLPLEPILLGGGQDTDRRAGTENLAAIAGLTMALERFVPTPVFDRRVLGPLARALCDRIVALPGSCLLSDPTSGLNNTVSCLIEGCDSLALLAGLDLEGICASGGAACSAGALEPSHVVLAMGYSPGAARSFLRFSLGRDSTMAEVDRVGHVLARVVERIRQAQ